ncbi:MAG: TetR family transcriptional regulator [Salinisphaeraceae bacterium]
MENAPPALDGVEKIRRAAADLFGERGFDAVSIAHIAERAGSSKANIFHHFGSKEALYFAVLREAVDRSTDHFRDAMRAELDPSQRVERAIRGSLTVLFEDPERSRLIFREIMESGPCRAEALANEVFGDDFIALTRLFADVQAGDEAGQGMSPSFLAHVLLSSNVMLFHCHQVLRHLPGGGYADEQERYITMLRDVLLRSMRAQKETNA